MSVVIRFSLVRRVPLLLARRAKVGRVSVAFSECGAEARKGSELNIDTAKRDSGYLAAFKFFTVSRKSVAECRESINI